MDTGEVPGYEFEVPRGSRQAGGPRPAVGHASISSLQGAGPEPPRAPVLTTGRGVFAVMRSRNWLLGLAVPILAAITVGVALVVVSGGGGGNGGAGPSALSAGFPPARLAGASFAAGKTAKKRVILSAIGASAGTEVIAGGVNGGPAIWSSADGGTTWTRGTLSGAATLIGNGAGQLSGVAHGTAGWLAVGTTVVGGSGPLIASSTDARTWTVASGVATDAVASAVAAGPAGYVIVGHRMAGEPSTAVADAWYATGLTGFRQAQVVGSGGKAADVGQMMNAATATGHGFVAVGAAGTEPAAWLSTRGRKWRQVAVPMPGGAQRAALDYVAAHGSDVVAAGTDFSAAGASQPFVEVSTNAGATWTERDLPVPDIGPRTGTTVTALTEAGGGFAAAGTYVTAAGPEVVLWTLAPGAPVTDAASWAEATPRGTGLSGSNSENAITALAADGATLTGVGFTATLARSGDPGAQQPTLWRSPIR